MSSSVKLASGIQLNPADRENGLALLGEQNGRQRANRKGGGAWVGVRADHGVVNQGRWAFCVWNETGGNLRVGWSCEDASLALGKDKWGFGYGGTATKSNSNQFTKYGQTYGPGDAITCCVDLDRRAITYMKNGREIPGDAFNFGKELHGFAIFPHVYTKEATFSVSFDGRGGAPPLVGGFKWISEAGPCLYQGKRRAKPGEGLEDLTEGSKSGGGGGKYVLTAYGWRTQEEAGISAASQEWRTSLEAYVKHFTALLELEYEAEKEAVVERVQKRTSQQLEADGVGVVGLSAEFDQASGRISLYSMRGQIPYLSEISRGRTVLISTVDGGVDVEDATKTISGEIESISADNMMVSTQYERMPYGGRGARPHLFRVDLGPNIIAYKRIDKMLDELQRCLGTSQVEQAKSKIEKLNTNANLSGLLLPGAPLANALYSDIAESTSAASKWDPLERPKPNPESDISKAAREPHINAPPYVTKGKLPDGDQCLRLNRSQEAATRIVLERRRRFSLIQGPPGTGKTTTAVATICGWLRSKKGPVLASAFSNRGTDNLAEVLHGLGVKVLRMGLCSQDAPYSLESRLAECGMSRGESGLKAIMQQVDVVCATSIGCGMGPLDRIKFPFIVVDEAAQVMEPAVILPLGKGAVQAVMVGDQCQLPATILSREAQKGGLDISMFDRLMSMGMEVQLLNEQYRMHPQIASFPSWRFYRGELKSAVQESQRQLPPGLAFQSHALLIHVEAKESQKGASKRNQDETAAAAWVVDHFLKRNHKPLVGDEIGVITPYAAQVTDIRNALPNGIRDMVQVSSVDAFQGCQKEVIIVSLVRANPRGEVGFVSDWRRLNVALTRAKKLCVVLAHLPTWLSSESALLRDWIGFYPAEVAQILAFNRAQKNVGPLPAELEQQVGLLRNEFAQNRPAAAKLPRVSVESRGGASHATEVKRKALEAGRALADAINKADEDLLEQALNQAHDAGIQNSSVQEAEECLRRLVSLRELKVAAEGDDEAALQAAVFLAQSAGVSEADISEVEASFNNRIQKRMEEEMAKQRHAKALAVLDGAIAGSNTLALKAALAEARDAGATENELEAGNARLKEMQKEEAQRREEARKQDLARRQELNSRLEAAKQDQNVAKARLNSDSTAKLQERIAAAVARKKAETPAPEPLFQSAPAPARRTAPEPAFAPEPASAASSLGIPEVPGMKRMQLRVLEGVGCGLELQPTKWGMVVEAVDPKPGQPLLKVGDCMVEINKKSLVGLDEETCEDTFGAAHKHGCWLRAVSGEDAGVDVNDLESAETKFSQYFAKHTLDEAVEDGNEAALREALAEAKQSGLKETADAEAALRTMSAARELADAGVLIGALERAGVVQAEDVATYKAAYEEAKAAGVERHKLSEAEAILRRVDGVKEEAPAFPPEPPSSLPVAAAASEPEAKRRKVELPPVDVKKELGEETPMQRWSICMIEVALLQCRKRKAVEDEDFDLAHSLKKHEAAASERLAAAREQAVSSGSAGASGGAEEGEESKRKRQKVDEELQEIKRAKKEAVENENYSKASELRRREQELEKSQRGDDATAATAAVELLKKFGPVGLAAVFEASVAACAAGAGTDVWEAVGADLQVAASGSAPVA
eukprot:TRINITY_DN27000_c0_g1_i1.p1 TRINITY_DN27000_c0_g1~~TRINITY_DN27000_c0_g1_i1.p1  ORF type:complete len:1619 (-),score=376.47 TRINITY_DN27000_c0_g1_i1:52-4908(-)